MALLILLIYLLGIVCGWTLRLAWFEYFGKDRAVIITPDEKDANGEAQIIDTRDPLDIDL